MENLLGSQLLRKISDNLFSLSPVTIYFLLKNILLHAYNNYMPLPNLNIVAICKLGKGINQGIN